MTEIHWPIQKRRKLVDRSEEKVAPKMCLSTKIIALFGVYCFLSLAFSVKMSILKRGVFCKWCRLFNQWKQHFSVKRGGWLVNILRTFLIKAKK
ncbi:hypothetical protein WNX60_12755 [Lacticaseibacillus paracasei]